jgi:predicted DNA-binding antitoxin AbrB/MazE fold protein
LSRIVRARYEKGMLKPLEEVGLREGEEVLIKIERLEERERIIEEYKGFMGEISEEELKELIEEAELEKL